MCTTSPCSAAIPGEKHGGKWVAVTREERHWVTQDYTVSVCLCLHITCVCLYDCVCVSACECVQECVRACLPLHSGLLIGEEHESIAAYNEMHINKLGEAAHDTMKSMSYQSDFPWFFRHVVYWSLNRRLSSRTIEPVPFPLPVFHREENAPICCALCYCSSCCRQATG
jgi:hypothetical protein